MRITIRWQHIIVGAVLAAGLIGLLARTASADRPYSVRSFVGTYRGSALEIRQDDPLSPVEYCDMEGSFTPDGAGNGSFDITRRCSIEGTIHDALTFTYEVSPTGMMTFVDSTGDEGRAQLVDDGNSAITSSALDPDPDPRVFVRHGIFTRP
jgi:hypothetical protein